MQAKKTILICGHGPGISNAVAAKFGGAGFAVALIARDKDRLTAAVQALAASGIEARAFPCDLGDPQALPAMLGEIRASMPPIAVVHWNAYASGAGDLLTTDVAALRTAFEVGVVGLVALIQATQAELAAQPDGAVLVTGGGFAGYDPKLDEMIVQWNAMGVAVAKAAQRKLVGLLHARLRDRGIYVAEVVVLSMVKGTAFDSGNATLEASAIAAKFWDLYTARKELSVTIR